MAEQQPEPAKTWPPEELKPYMHKRVVVIARMPGVVGANMETVEFRDVPVLIGPADVKLFFPERILSMPHVRLWELEATHDSFVGKEAIKLAKTNYKAYVEAGKTEEDRESRHKEAFQ